MNYEFYILGGYAFIIGIILLYKTINKRKTIKESMFCFLLYYSLMAIGFGVLTISLKKYDYICAFLMAGIHFSITYKDKTSRGMNIDYLWHLDGYIAAFSLILYGLAKILM